MSSCLFVALGGALGSVLRYLIGLIKIKESAVFPYKTLIINIVGSFLIGLIVAWTVKNGNLSSNMILFMKVGICGGFTTFSTFAFESADLIQNGRAGIAILYIVLSVAVSVAAVFTAQICVRA